MLKKIALAGAAIAATFTALPAAAEARHRDGYSESRYDRGYRGYQRYRPGDYYGGQRHNRYGNRHDNRYGNRYNDYRYNDRRYQGRCRDDGTTGTIVGAIAGGLIGREVAGRRGDRTVGTIIGGAAGALAGRAIDRDC